MSTRIFIILVILVAISFIIAKWPHMMYFQIYAFGDPGANLVAYHLVQNGWKPTVDFNYLYGLLSLLIGQIIFDYFGYSPLVYALSISLISIILIIILAITIVALKAPSTGKLLFIVAIPFILFQMPAINYAHRLEAVFISLAIYNHAHNKIIPAILFAILAIFAKPALGYVYCFLLIIELLTDRKNLLHFKHINISNIICIILLIFIVLFFIVYYGSNILFNSLLPFKAMRVYEFANFGFFAGHGRMFWNPPGANYRYYLGNPVGFWLITTIILGIAFVAMTMNKLFYGLQLKKFNTSLITMHYVFIIYMFGNAYSWPYYSYILVLSIITLKIKYNIYKIITSLLSILLFIGYYTEFNNIINTWYSRKTHNIMNKLYSEDDFATDWSKILELSDQKSVFILTYIGAVFILEPRVDSTHAWCLYPWMATSTEKIDLMIRLYSSQVIVVPMYNNVMDIIYPIRESSKWMADILSEFPYVTELKHFRILSRTPLSIKHGD